MFLWCRIAFATILAGLLPVTTFAEKPSRILFEQPSLPSIRDHFFVPTAPSRPQRPKEGFGLTFWQTNPDRADGFLVPSSWHAGDKTGFYPSEPVAEHQVGFRDGPGTTAQMDGNTVGAYINSTDLRNGSHKYKMMITPQFMIDREHQISPFAQPGKALVTSLELQIPTASATKGGGKGGSNVYAAADLQFLDKTSGTKLSYGCNVFFFGHGGTGPGRVGFDEDSHSIMINSRAIPNNPWLTLAPGSATQTGTPWKGWRQFTYSITEENFRTALTALKQEYPNSHASTNPADYVLVHFHLNAELHFKAGPAELGWSMRNAKITLEDM